MNNQAFNLFILFSISYIYCLIFAPSIEKVNNNYFIESINKINTSCFLPCHSNICNNFANLSRGKQYFISGNKDINDKIKNCLITFYNFSHFILFFLLGFFSPNYCVFSFIIGLLFEYYEFIYLNCHDIWDIFWNFFGLVVGFYLQKYYKNNINISRLKNVTITNKSNFNPKIINPKMSRVRHLKINSKKN